MKMFEISSKKNKNGRRKFKAVLYKIFPDSCVDESNQIGTMYNKNGITWIREYCEKALPSIAGMSLRCEFSDEERTQLLGHGDTDIIDNEPVFEDAVVIGTFTKGYIEDIETDEGFITVCIGEGEIDAQCYHNFVTKLDEDIANGIYPNGSVEIMHTTNNEEIIYKYGYKETGRIPMEFIHSGYALLGVAPADDSAKLIELNRKHKEESNEMTDMEIKNIVSQTVVELSSYASEVAKCKEDCAAQITKVNQALNKAVAEKNEIEASSQQIKDALEAVKAEREALDKKYDELWAENQALKKALANAQAKERINEMNAALAEFSDEEKAYAKTEIDAFNADPVASEINSIVNKIWEGIGKAAKANNHAVAEQNAVNVTVEDIFSEVEPGVAPKEDVNIF